MSDARIKVLFVMIHMAMGGSERLILNLVRQLDRKKFEPSVAWFEGRQPLQTFADEGIKLHHVPKVKRIDLATMSRLAHIIRAERIDVVNAHHFLPFVYSYYGAKVANRARLVYTEHSAEDVLTVDRKWRAIGRSLLRTSDGAIGISRGVADRLASHFRLEKRLIHLVENGVDLQLFSPNRAARAHVIQTLGVSPQDVLIGHVANFRHNKNHLFLLEAFRRVAQEHRHVKLLIVGQGFPGDSENSEPAVREFIHRHALGDTVRLVGYHEDVTSLLRALDIFCLVSHKEGLPLSLMEATATGLPAVGTDIEGIRDVITHDLNGLLVAPDDVPALASALDRLVKDRALRERMSSAAREVAVDRYSLGRCVRQTEDVFLALAARRTSPSLESCPTP